MKIGWIGLGKIESVLTGHLLTTGHSMSVHDIRPKCGPDLVATGAVWADTPGTVARLSDVIFTSLPVPSKSDR
jgi:3-hydroxyisobutyrate dehydrogenase-like beta-hydroxyacid dehydrogenase